METINDPQAYGMYVYDPACGRIITTMRLMSALEPQHVGPDEYVSTYSKKTLQQLKDEGTVSSEAEMLRIDDAARKVHEYARNIFCKGPKEITRRRWYELLEVLPPEGWFRDGDSETFMVPECITSCLYCYGIRIGSRYFEMVEDVDVDRNKLIVACKQLNPAEFEDEDNRQSELQESYDNNARDYALMLVEQDTISAQRLLEACIKMMSEYDVRTVLHDLELTPSKLYEWED